MAEDDIVAMRGAGSDYSLWRHLGARPAGMLAALADTSGLSPAVLAAALDGLTAAGVPVAHASGLYWCDAPLQPLAWSDLPPGFEAAELHDQLPSTQDRALALLREAGCSRVLVVAESQTAGRGRGGAAWLSPLGAHLIFTLGWRFRGADAAKLAGLSVRLGLALARALRAHGLPVRIKWPNDLWLCGRKLGGILIEAHPSGSDMLICAGFGINHRMPRSSALPWPTQAWIDLAAAFPQVAPRSDWMRVLLPALCAELDSVQAGVDSGWAQDFHRFDALAGAAVRFQRGERMDCGTAAGITADGRLRVLVEDAEQQVTAGEVQLLRPEQRDVDWQLLLDCGNTRLKWAWSAVVDGRNAVLAGGAVSLRDKFGVLQAPAQIAADLFAAVSRLHNSEPPDAIWLCSSFGGDRDALREAIGTRFGLTVPALDTPAHAGPWRSAYPNPTRLGLDRALAMRGALDLPDRPERTLLVSVGSALTLDLLAADGQHLGGLIGPSPTLSMQALHCLSPRLDPAGATYHGLACDSADAVYSASLQSAAGLVERVVRQRGAALVLLSGGGAGPVQALLDLPRVTVQANDTLVLRGLAHWRFEQAATMKPCH